MIPLNPKTAVFRFESAVNRLQAWCHGRLVTTIGAWGSIGVAAGELGVSYKRPWLL